MKITNQEYAQLCRELADAMSFVAAVTYNDNATQFDEIVQTVEEDYGHLDIDSRSDIAVNEMIGRITLTEDLYELSAGIETMLDALVVMSGKSSETVMKDIQDLMETGTTNDLVESLSLRQQNKLN